MPDCDSRFRIFGEVLYCKLPAKHEGNHVYPITWTDEDADKLLPCDSADEGMFS